MTNYTVICSHCKTAFQRAQTNPKQRFCSRDCVNAFRTANAKHQVKYHELTCEGCGKKFLNRHVRQRYCSHACDGIRFKVNKTRKCEQCGKQYKRLDTHTKQRFCSRKCVFDYNSSRAIGQPQIPCEACGKPFTVEYKGKRYCSRKCHGTALKTRLLLATNIQKIATAKPPSKPEIKMRKALTELCILFYEQHPFYWYSIDFFLPNLNIALEVDGVYWHSQPKYKVHDKRRDVFITAKGIKVVRITDTEINNTDNLTGLVEEALGLTT